jgi:hypothetical protein
LPLFSRLLAKDNMEFLHSLRDSANGAASTNES